MTKEQLIILALNGKRFKFSDIYNIVVEDVDMHDYPDFADAFIYEAMWIVDNTFLTEDELGWLNDTCRDITHDAAFEQIF